MNQDQSMDHDARRRAILRISVVEAAFSLAWLGLALWTGFGRYDDRTFYLVLGVICGMATLLFLCEPLITGASRQQLKSIRPQLRPGWFYFVFIFMFFVYAVISFPIFAEEIGFKANGVVAVLAIFGISGLLVSTFNIVKFGRSWLGQSIPT